MSGRQPSTTTNVPGPQRRDLGVLLLAVLAQAGVALWLGRGAWFSADVLEFYLERGGAPDGRVSLSDPHQGQWRLGLLVAHLLLFKLVGLTTFLPFLLLSVAAHAALVLVVHRVLLRLDAGRLPALAAALVLLTYGGGSGAFLADSPLGLTAPVLLGALAVLVLVRGEEGWRGTLIAALVLVVAVTFSWGGLAAVAWAGVAALGRPPWRAGLVTAPALAAFAAWGALRGDAAEPATAAGRSPVEIALSSGELMVTPFGDVLGSQVLGSVLLLGILVAVVWPRGRRTPLAKVASGGILGAAVLAVARSVGDPAPGSDVVNDSSYAYAVLALMVPASALALGRVAAFATSGTARRSRRPVRSRWALPVLTALAAMAVAVSAVTGQARVHDHVEDRGELARGLLAGTIEAGAAGERMLSTTGPGTLPRGRDLLALSAPELEGELPALDASPQDRLDAESRYFVAVTPDGLDLAPPASVTTRGFTREVTGRPGCRVHTASGDSPTVVLSSFVGAGLRFRGGDGTVVTQLSRADEDRTTAPVEWRTTSGEWTYVATTAQLAELAITFDAAGDYTLCFGS